MVHEAPRYHGLCQEMQDRKVFPREVRDIIYGYTFQDLRVLIREESGNSGTVDRPLDWLTERSFPYSYLLQPTGYFEDYPFIRQELIEAWYENSTFNIAEAKTITTFHSRSQWSAGLKPFKFVREVEISMPEHDLTANQTRYSQQLESLFVLKKGVIITIGLWDLIPGEKFLISPLVPHTTDKYAGFVEWLFPVLRRLRIEGYKVIIRLECNITFVVEPEETTVEGWAKKIHAAIKERETLMRSLNYFTDEDDSDYMWDMDDSDNVKVYADPDVD